ncbi:MAG: hypothetical protein UR28_C0035G0010 [Candidatus Peregrinibacteria bacterium GW2011_GWF2_33_10]|nr:MAG: hypothetical protein UR28_C0035G0010 [Candidatus Peregrinibacteria bacterium GW2011_GWF2_33_10]
MVIDLIVGEWQLEKIVKWKILDVARMANFLKIYSE